MRKQVTLSQDPVDARQFEVTVKHLANSLNFGQEESVFHGGGLEYAQSRLYVAGDPVNVPLTVTSPVVERPVVSFGLGNAWFGAAWHCGAFSGQMC